MFLLKADFNKKELIKVLYRYEATILKNWGIKAYVIEQRRKEGKRTQFTLTIKPKYGHDRLPLNFPLYLLRGSAEAFLLREPDADSHPISPVEANLYLQFAVDS